ncbi:hypothetical protein NP493_202g01036 [Ridgeia piscesae]|uniref:DNA 3'-5' helicase n=1 Tax=Ridgeia piscesae TaxID=27915 RepID=A0AAD9UEI5_RIDPI|nr:hypothetical protein NP493_202g01036 [Ridgeia piscesae]
MVHYCENVTDCRRSQLLEYFGEVFDRKQCHSNPAALCDNCSSTEVFCCRDVSEDVKLIIRGVQKILASGFRHSNFTLLHLVEVFKGSRNAKVMENGHNNCVFYGRGKSYSRSDCERLWRQLVVDGVLAEKLFVTAQDHTVCYMELGRKAQDVLQGKLKVEFQMRKSGQTAETTHQGGEDHGSSESELTKECYNELVSLAKTISQRLQYKNYTSVFNNATLQEMASSPPLTLDEMKDIDGVSAYKLAQYGQQFLEVTMKYAVMIASMDEAAEDMTDTDGLQESRYFNSNTAATSTNSGKKRWKKRKPRGATTQKGKRQWGATKGKGRAAPKKSASMSAVGASKRVNLAQYKRPEAAGTAFSSASHLPSRKPRLLNAPAPRSFLGGGGGTFFG